MEIISARSFYRAFNRASLSEEERTRFNNAIHRFSSDPFHPSLNYERLGRRSRLNQCSIRASRELRVILAVEPEFQNPEKVMLLYADHHDSAYLWAKRREYHTEAERAVNLREVAPPDADPVKALSSLLDFEEWQLFLHPDQEPLVKRHYAGGEARIRGAAGTGKTVVALHRAAELGRRYAGDKVLFTTFSRSLTQHLQQLYLRIPNAPENVVFLNIDRVARGLVREASMRWVDPPKVAKAFDAAYAMVGMQLVRALVAGRPENRVPRDGLLILDDAAQRIYAGGFRLSWAGLQVKGRSEILATNYRNPRPVVEAAKAVRGEVLPVMEDNDDGAALHAEFVREKGPLPVFIQVGRKDEVRTIAQAVRQLVDEESVTHDSIGVLMRSNDDAERAGKALSGMGIPCSMLRGMRDGALGDGVRVGTFDRSKGMEFRAVFIPRLGASVFPHKEAGRPLQPAIPGLPTMVREPTDEEREARQLDLDRLYVGMTRATERLFLIADETPCPEIENARPFFRCDYHRIGGPISSDP